jgi:hypothetical protein
MHLKPPPLAGYAGAAGRVSFPSGPFERDLGRIRTFIIGFNLG